MEGFERGRNLEKVGQHAQDTAELFFEDVHVPVENRLGEEGQGFRYMTAEPGPGAAEHRPVGAGARRRGALDWTLEYVKQRTAFGQHDRLVSELALRAGRDGHGDRGGHGVLRSGGAGAQPRRPVAASDAAMAKWWATELQGRVIDRCVQLHGGYGYMLEYPIARAFVDARVTRIYGGTTEIMKEIIGRSLGV